MSKNVTHRYMFTLPADVDQRAIIRELFFPKGTPEAFDKGMLEPYTLLEWDARLTPKISHYLSISRNAFGPATVIYTIVDMVEISNEDDIWKILRTHDGVFIPQRKKFARYSQYVSYQYKTNTELVSAMGTASSVTLTTTPQQQEESDMPECNRDIMIGCTAAVPTPGMMGGMPGNCYGPATMMPHPGPNGTVFGMPHPGPNGVVFGMPYAGPNGHPNHPNYNPMFGMAQMPICIVSIAYNAPFYPESNIKDINQLFFPDGGILTASDITPDQNRRPMMDNCAGRDVVFRQALTCGMNELTHLFEIMVMTYSPSGKQFITATYTTDVVQRYPARGFSWKDLSVKSWHIRPTLDAGIPPQGQMTYTINNRVMTYEEFRTLLHD